MEKSIEIIENSNPKSVPIEQILDKLQIQYDDNTDTISVKCSSNLLIQSNTNILISKGDTIILTGEPLGFKGKLLLNPIVEKIKSIFN